jgi:hypothetical protein
VAPPRSRSSLSSKVEVESEPRVGRGGDHRLRPRLSLSPGVGRGGVRRLPESRPSPSPGVGRGGVRRIPEPRLSPSPGVGRGGVRRLPEPRLSPSPGSGEAEFVVRGRDGGRAMVSGEAELPMAPEAGLGCCQPHSVEWHSSRSGAGGAVFLSGRSVRSLRLCRLTSARQDKVSGHPCIKCSYDTVGRRGDLAKFASSRRLGLGRAEGVSVA